ncbi:MAG TPA: PEP/pyruvate-binding domain-containing protein, partial [Chloroflexota bacterium]|nr:PEP/pyruvate-binding domain-containing protein [Chloroflexota bacterium]
MSATRQAGALQPTPEAALDTRGPLVVPLESLARDWLPLAGGKAANLGELLQAGLPVPPGVCVTTLAYDLAVAQAELDALVEELAALSVDDQARQAGLAGAVRARILAASVPELVARALRA